MPPMLVYMPSIPTCAVLQTVQYIQPHHSAQLAQAELLVIDEAAAIPLPTVSRAEHALSSAEHALTRSQRKHCGDIGCQLTYVTMCSKP